MSVHYNPYSSFNPNQPLLEIGERESDQMLQFRFTLISTAVIGKESGTQGDNLRWQNESLVTCVPRHLQLAVAFTIMGKPTVEARDTIVHSAKSHLQKKIF